MLWRKQQKAIVEWINNGKDALLVTGARQIGKTAAIKHFAEKNYQELIELNFAKQPQLVTIFEDGFSAAEVIKNISLADPTLRIIPGKTVILFDEIQENPDIATTLKAFNIDGNYFI